MCDDSGEVLQLAHVVGDKTSELEFKDMVVRVTVRDRVKAAVRDALYCSHAHSPKRALEGTTTRDRRSLHGSHFVKFDISLLLIESPVLFSWLP